MACLCVCTGCMPALALARAASLTALHPPEVLSHSHTDQEPQAPGAGLAAGHLPFLVELTV